MKSFEFCGEVFTDNGPAIRNCNVKVRVASDGSVEGVLTSQQFLSSDLFEHSQLTIRGVCSDDTTIEITDAFVTNLAIGNNNSLTFRAHFLKAVPSSSASVPQTAAYEYQLTNLLFSGVEITETNTDEGTSWSKDKLRFFCENYLCVLQQVEDYDEIVREARNLKGTVITSTLTISSSDGDGDDLDAEKTDAFCDAICELLSFATANTVCWVQRTRLGMGGDALQRYSRTVGKLSPLRSGWSLIPNWVSMKDGTARSELAYFMGSVSPLYVRTLRGTGLGLVLAWIVDSEHQGTIDMQYIAAFIAIERLRAKFLDRARVPAAITADWQEHVDNGMGDRIIEVVEEIIGPLEGQQKKLIISKVRSANNPPAALELQALCQQLGVAGFEKDMGELRSKLVHTGTFGDYDFPDAVQLLKKLSHIIAVCVLKLLQFDGYYHHWDTGWRLVPLKEHTSQE
jgi:hypothetical protein